MKLAVMIGAAALLCTAAAKPLAVGPLGPSDFADTEVSTNLPLYVDMERLDRVFLSIELLPSATNELMLVVGADVDADGELSAAEADVWLRCDCGMWESRGAGNLSSAQTNAAGRVRRTLEIPRKDFDPAWNVVRVVRRGIGEIDESAVADARRTHFSVRMR